MSDLFAPLLKGYQPFLSTSHVDGRAVLWVSPYRINDAGQIDMLSCEGPFRSIHDAVSAFSGRLRFSKKHYADCQVVADES